MNLDQYIQQHVPYFCERDGIYLLDCLQVEYETVSIVFANHRMRGRSQLRNFKMADTTGRFQTVWDKGVKLLQDRALGFYQTEEEPLEVGEVYVGAFKLHAVRLVGFDQLEQYTAIKVWQCSADYFEGFPSPQEMDDYIVRTAM